MQCCGLTCTNTQVQDKQPRRDAHQRRPTTCNFFSFGSPLFPTVVFSVSLIISHTTSSVFPFAVHPYQCWSSVHLLVHHFCHSLCAVFGLCVRHTLPTICHVTSSIFLVLHFYYCVCTAPFLLCSCVLLQIRLLSSHGVFVLGPQLCAHRSSIFLLPYTYTISCVCLPINHAMSSVVFVVHFCKSTFTVFLPLCSCSCACVSPLISCVMF